MFNFNAKVVVLMGSACLMTACGATDQVSGLKDKASQVQDLAGQAGKAKDLLANAGPLKDKVFGMKDGVSETLTAVKSGDFTTAKQSFGTLQQSWSEIEGDIKNISAEGHSEIQTGIDNVAADLNADNPNGDQIAQNLKGLTSSIGGLTGIPDAIGGAELDNASAEGDDAPTADIAAGDNSVESNLNAMKSSLAEAMTAVESADLGTAKTAFSDARQSWFKFGGSIKQSSAETYQAIDNGVKTVNSTLNSANPSTEALVSDLGTLSESLNEVTP